MSAEDITPGDVCKSAYGILGIVIGRVGNAYLGIRIADGGQWQSIDPTFICKSRDLLVPAQAAVQAAGVE